MNATEQLIFDRLLEVDDRALQYFMGEYAKLRGMLRGLLKERNVFVEDQIADQLLVDKIKELVPVRWAMCKECRGLTLHSGICIYKHLPIDDPSIQPE